MNVRLLVSCAVAVLLVAAVGSTRVPAANERPIQIVLLDDPPLAAYRGGIGDLAPTAPEATGASRLDPRSAPSVAYLEHLASERAAAVAAAEAALGRELAVRFEYDAVLNGFAVPLDEAEAAVVASLPGVTRVVREYDRELLTDAGPRWIGAPTVWSGSSTAGLPGTKGEGVVVGVIDTGVNTDHPSFAAVGPVDGYRHDNPRDFFYGLCDPVTGTPFCNEKLIGVHDFTGTTPEDTNGHGSHTASTAAGNEVDASLIAPTITIERRISGVAPHANLITYKACVTTCPLSAILASINQATLDAVDVINFSIGGGSSDPWSDPDALAFRNAGNAGVFVAVSAGNSGPGAATIGSPADAPWVMTVGASTHDRKFVNRLQNMAGGATAAPADIDGKSVTSGYGPAPIVYAGDFGDPLCQTPFPAGTWTNGEIVVCDRGVNPRLQKAENAAAGGAKGFVLANESASGDSTVADAFVIPGVGITYDDGVVLKAWLDTGSGHTATIGGTVLDVASDHGDVMAAFSSRGPNPATGDILKPDITGPGVDVLAAFNTTNPLSPPEYNVISGTSMSSPHLAGAATLVRAAHPEWSPDEVRSALVTTGFNTLPGSGDEVHDALKDDASTPTDPFDLGGGRVDLRRAAQAALVLDETGSSYESSDPAAGGDPAALNLPTLAEDDCAGTCSWTRVVRSSATATVTWSAATASPSGLGLSVSPSTFTLAPGATQTVTISADVRGLASDGWAFGQVVLVPDQTVPEAHLAVAVNRTGGGSARTVLHFQGNVDEGCQGNGATDLEQPPLGCDGPFLLEKTELDSGAAARFGPVPVVLDCGVDRCPTDPNWVWNLDGPTTLEGAITVEWWQASGPADSLLLFDDFFIILWADGVKVSETRVRHNLPAPGVPVRLKSTVAIPRTTASETFVLQIDPIFISQDESTVYYDSSGSCTGATAGSCDSLVRMPVVVETKPDLEVTALDVTSKTTASGVREGDTALVTATVANTGDAAAPASRTEFLLDGSTVLGVVDTPELPAGATTTVAVEWSTEGVKGEHTIRATADHALAITESDETNNAATRTVTVKGNKVTNGSFEQSSGGSPSGWTGSSTGAGSTSSDSGSVSMSGSGGSVLVSGNPTWTSDPFAVTGGEALDLVVALRVTEASSAASVGLAYLDAVGAVLQTVSLLEAPLRTDGVQTLETALTVPAGVAQARVVVAGFAATDTATAGTVTLESVGLYAR